MATLLRENSESIKEEVEKMKVSVVTAIIICSISDKTICVKRIWYLVIHLSLLSSQIIFCVINVSQYFGRYLLLCSTESVIRRA